MSDAARGPMGSDAFIALAMAQREGVRHELAGGEVVAMAPERAAHARAKLRIAAMMLAAVQEAGLPCEVFGDGMAVEIDNRTIYEPDVLLRCGAPLPDDAVKIVDPVVVVEVVSPSSRARDTGAKLVDYFRMPSVWHYLIVRTEDRKAILHSRRTDGSIQAQILGTGPVRLDPPGLTIGDPFA